MANTKRPPQTAGARYLKQDLGEDFLDQIEDDEDDPTAPSSTAPVVCLIDAPVRFEIAGRKYKMRLGDVEHLQVGYVSKRLRNPQGDPIPSAIELLTGRKVLPVSDDRVQKDKNGVPIVTLQARKRAEDAAKTEEAQNKPQGPGARA